MKKCFAVFCCLLGCVAAISAQDITNLEKIGPIVSFTTTQKAVTLTCWDDSQVQLTVLAADLVRVRTSFGKPIPSRDHSWAIERTDWQTPRWSFLWTTISVAQIARGYNATINTPEGRYDPGKRKFNFVIKSDKRTPNVATMVDDSGARRIKID